MNRIDLYITGVTDEGWHPGLPPAGAIVDVRPVALRAETWGHLLVVGPLAGDHRVLVRVPSDAKAHKAGVPTMGMPMDPSKTEWRPIQIPDHPETIHA